MKTTQPTLFDKLSLNSNAKKPAAWREVLLRDISCLLNDASRSGSLPLDAYPYCANAVINYGLPSLSKEIPVRADATILAMHIHKILVTFEPRLEPSKIMIRPVMEPGQSAVLALLFDISAVTAIPGKPTRVDLRIAIDYSCGAIQVL